MATKGMKAALEEARQKLDATIRKAMKETLEASEVDEARNLETLVARLGTSLGENGRKPRIIGPRKSKPEATG